MFSEGYEELARLLLDGDAEGALWELGVIDQEELECMILYVEGLICEMLELMIHRGLDGDPEYDERDGDEVSINNYLRDVEIRGLADEIRANIRDRGKRPPLLDHGGLAEAIASQWDSALRSVSLRVPGVPYSPEDLEARLDRDRLLAEAMALITEEST